MSKKSRKRNRRILGALAALGTGLALANRGKGTEMSNVSVDSGRGSGLRPTVDDVEFKESIVSTPTRTKTTVIDSMPKRPKFNQKSKRVTPDGKTYTIEGVKQGIVPKVQNPKTKFVSGKNIFIDSKPFTKETLRAQKEMERGMLPPQLRVPVQRTPDILQGVPESALMAKKGGRIVKGKKTAVRTGAAKRGFGRAFKGGRK